MTEHDELPEDEVEAHGLKEAAAGVSAAALLAAGAGAAKAATPAGASANAKQAGRPAAQKVQKKTESVNKFDKKDAMWKVDRAGARVNTTAADKV